MKHGSPGTEDPEEVSGSGGKTYLIVVNWNGWKDTVECLESALRSDYPRFQIVVCDNGSTDGSVARLQEWAEGRLSARVPADPALRHLSFPPVRKPIPYALYDRAVAERGGVATADDVPLVIITTGANLGYAGGNNVGLRYALARGDLDYAWLLNNDTVVRPDSLRRMIEKVSGTPGAGLCGSLLFYYDQPEVVQAAGGFRLNTWFGMPRPIAQFCDRHGSDYGEDQVERTMFGVQGASMLATREFLQKVGLLSEAYFLYFEEPDWAARARKAGFKLTYSERSIVYHKEGASTAANGLRMDSKSELSDRHLVRSRLIFTRRHFPHALPTVYLSLLFTIANRIRRGQIGRVPMILRTAAEALWKTDG